jgi:serine/threonine protein kinase
MEVVTLRAIDIEVDSLVHTEGRVLLGEGTYGMVYAGTLIKTGTKVAIKRYKQAFLKHFGHEACNARNLNHLRVSPHVHFIYSGVDPADSCIVMDSVERMLRGCAADSAGKVRTFFIGLLQHLDTMHAVGYVHFDIKMENIGVMAGAPVLLDLGDVTHVTSADMVYGYAALVTLWTRPPEITMRCNNEEVHRSGKIDVWSLACTIWEWVSGTPPFPARDVTDLMRRITHTVGPPSARMLECTMGTTDTQNKPPASWVEGETPLFRILKKRGRGGARVELTAGACVPTGVHLEEPFKCFEPVLRRMLQVDPRDRATAKEALNMLQAIETEDK